MPAPYPDPCFTLFSEDISRIEIPEKFTFPFYYTPHPLALKAAHEVMQQLEYGHITEHNFGLDPGRSGLAIGKMFGILIVRDTGGKIGYLKAFSGKLHDSNHLAGFVPPIFDMLDPGGFFVKGEQELNRINAEIEQLQTRESYLRLLDHYRSLQELAERGIHDFRQLMKTNKKNRDAQRSDAQAQLSEEAYEAIREQLKNQSLKDQFELKILRKSWSGKLAAIREVIDQHEDVLQSLRDERKARSNQLQQRLFDQYNFLNGKGERINVRTVFEDHITKNPPSGAGECATPKLLQYAFAHQYRPLAMAEFWWGKSPESEIRKHGEYYPACRGKCEPILNFMLRGIEVEDNPMMESRSLAGDLDILYEDEHIVVINKPAEFLSVPGKHIRESVLTVLQDRYPHATGPLLVHRLDMSTSGILIAGKTKEVHQNLQAQFIRKTVQKRYVALLEGKPEGEGGHIELPLRVDLDNRPHQLVCYEYGKMSMTRWELVESKGNVTKVYFYPLTGRTHQLRVHAAHPAGLNMPILGDDLYGHKANRLYLHADHLEVLHPATRRRMSFFAPHPF